MISSSVDIHEDTRSSKYDSFFALSHLLLNFYHSTHDLCGNEFVLREMPFENDCVKCFLSELQPQDVLDLHTLDFYKDDQFAFLWELHSCKICTNTHVRLDISHPRNFHNHFLFLLQSKSSIYLESKFSLEIFDGVFSCTPNITEYL